LAAALQQDFGITDSSCVALYCPNHVDYLPICLAVSLCGSKLTPINPLYTSIELETVLVKSRSEVLIVHMSKLDVGLQTIKNCPTIRQVIVITDDPGDAVPEGTISLDTFRHHKGSFDKTTERVHSSTDSHPFLLPYSSGTTGMPKGVCLTHENIVANLLQIDQVEKLTFTPGMTLISPLPFFHIYAFTTSLLYCAWKGQTVITMSGRFDLEHFCMLVEKHRPDRAHLVPPIILSLAKHPIVDKYDFSSMKMIVSAAAPLSVDTEKAVKERINVNVKQAWGMSELSPMGTLNSDVNARSGSVGPLAASTVGKVIDENGNSLGPNEVGELLIKGPQVMIGKTNLKLEDSGWLLEY
jgi:4-coumarate--CoA ligase